MKLIQKSSIWKSALLGAFLSLAFSLTAFAMTARISFNDPTAEPGEDVTVSMHVVSTSGEPLGSANIMLSYDPSLLEFTSGDNAEGGAGSIHVTGQPTEDAAEWYYGLHFKALSAGTADLTVSTAEIYDQDSKIASIEHQGSSHILIGAEAQASESASQAAELAPLGSLSINPGTLTPAFDPSVTSYTTRVGEEVTRIAVSAVPADSTQKVSVTGNDDLQMGENTINISISDKDGNALNSYTITVTKQEGATPTETAVADEATVKIDDTVYTVADTFDVSLLPEGWTAESYTYEGRVVQAGKGPDEHLHLMYLLAEGGTGDLYFYDDTSGSWSPYVEVGTSAKAVTAIPMDAGVTVPEGLEESRLNLNGKSVDGWVGTGDQGENYCVFYGMNSDGEKNFYRFDLKEKTLQRYFGAENSGTKNQAESSTASDAQSDLAKKYSRRGMELIAACVVALIAIIAAIWLAFRKDGGDGPNGHSDRPGSDADFDSGSRTQDGGSSEDADSPDQSDFEAVDQVDDATQDETDSGQEKPFRKEERSSEHIQTDKSSAAESAPLQESSPAPGTFGSAQEEDDFQDIDL